MNFERRGTRVAIIAAIGILLAALPIAIVLVGRNVRRVEMTDFMERDSSRVPSNFEHLVGEFHESNHSLPGPPLVVDLALYADVNPAEKGTYVSLMEQNAGRLRSVVSDVIRAVPARDLTEPTLTTLKRKMKVALVEATGTPTPIFDSLLIPEIDARQVQ